MKAIVIGGVAAGMSAASKLRRVLPDAQIAVYERGGYLSYGACGLPYYIGGFNDDPGRLIARTREQYDKMGIETHLHHEVLSVDPDARRVRVKDHDSGREFEDAYDALMIAVGCNSVAPKVPGADLPSVFYLKTMEDGLLSLDDTLASFFPEKLPEHPTDELLSIRLRDLLTMSSGFGGAFLMNGDRRAGTGAPDYVAYMLSLPVREKPGSRFCYSTADSILAGRMVEKAVGKTLSLYLYERLFSKLGQGFPLWDHCPEGHPIGGGGMFLSLTEMMKPVMRRRPNGTIARFPNEASSSSPSGTI